MKAFKRIAVSVFVLVLIFSAITVPGIAADDIQDFIGKHEQQRIEEELNNTQPPPSNERPATRPAYYTFQSSSSSEHRGDYIEGERLETRFDLAPALQGGGIPRLQTVQTTQAPEEEECEECEPITQEIEPISDFVPPPNTGRESYFIGGAFGAAALFGGMLLTLRKRAARR